MHRCPFCYLPLDEKPPGRCPRCARSLIGAEPIANADLAQRNHAGNRQLNRQIFIIAAGAFALVPCLAFLGFTTIYRWPISLALGLASGWLIWVRGRSITFATLVFAVPQMVAPGIGYILGAPVNPLAWLGYLAFGSILGWWRQSLRDVQ
jgi:hypothetical protein